MTIEEKVSAYQSLKRQIEELEEKRKELLQEILASMNAKELTVGDQLVRRYSLFNIKLSLEEAKQWGAVKLEEVVDRKKIKALVLEGNAIPGVTETHFIRISSAK